MLIDLFNKGHFIKGNRIVKITSFVVCLFNSGTPKVVTVRNVTHWCSVAAFTTLIHFGLNVFNSSVLQATAPKCRYH